MKLFELFATLGLDTSGFDNGVKGAQGKMSSLAKSFSSGFDKAAKASTAYLTVAGTALAGFTKIAVNNAANVIAEQAAFSSTFGEMAGKAKNAYKSIAESANILESRLHATATKGFAQLQGSGMKANEALEASTRLISLAADGAAYYDMSLEDVDARLRSFLRGNVEAGDSIGLFTNELQRNEMSLDLYNKKWDKLNESQRQMVMLNIAEQIYEQSKVIGQAERESDGWANTVSNLQKAWEETTAAFGKPVIEAITPAINGIVETLQSEEVETALSEFGTTIGGVLGDGIVGFNDALKWVIENKDGVADAFKAITVAAAGIVAIKHPIGIAISALAVFISDVMKAMEKAEEFASQKVPALTEKAEAAGAPPESVSEIVEIAEKQLATDKTVIDVVEKAGKFVTPLVANTFSLQGKQNVADTMWGHVATGLELLATKRAERTIEQEAQKARDRLSPYESMSLYEKTGNEAFIPAEYQPGANLTQTDLQQIAKDAGLSPAETRTLMNGGYSPTLMSGSSLLDKGPKRPSVETLAPFVDMELAAKDMAAAITEAEKAYYAAKKASEEAGGSISEGAEETTKTLGEIVVGVEAEYDALEGSSGQAKTAGETIKGATEEMIDSTEQLQESAKSTEEAVANMFPGRIETSSVTNATNIVQKALSSLMGKISAVYAMLSGLFALNPGVAGGHFATGLERVPYDGFPAILHKDEMVLDRQDANAYRNGDAPGQSKGGVTVNQYIQAVPQTASELAFQTMNALEMLRFDV